MDPAVRYPWEQDPPPAATPVVPEPQTKRRGRRPAGSAPTVTAAAPSIQQAWLYHHLTLSGPADRIGAFAAAARGAGVVPWRLDFAAIEEDVFVRAISQPPSHRHLTVQGCRILARQFRERVEAHQARATALVGQSRACPFDLHTLLPVPAAILQLGPMHPEALAWLAAQWGTDRLRQVTERIKPPIGRRLPKTHSSIGYGFFTAGNDGPGTAASHRLGSPYAAIARLGDLWPDLRFLLLPRPAG
jgi:hypothetical protein